MLNIKKRNKEITEKKYQKNLDAQRARLLDWLKRKPITTIEARKHLDVLAPAARVYELRHDFNLNIKTHWSNEITINGVSHKVGKYFLHPGTYKEVKTND